MYVCEIKFFVLQESFDRQSTRVCSEIYWVLGTADFIATQDLSFWGLSDLWSDIWPAIDGVVYLSILLERETTDGFEQFHQTASEWL